MNSERGAPELGSSRPAAHQHDQSGARPADVERPYRAFRHALVTLQNKQADRKMLGGIRRQWRKEFPAAIRCHSRDGRVMRRCLSSEHAVAVMIEEEAARYDGLSPIVRGPAELSHALLRILVSEGVASLAAGPMGSLRALRPLLARFIVYGLEQHAADRGRRYAKHGRAVRELVGQIELWARDLSCGGAEPKRIRVALQLALAEELAGGLVMPHQDQD